MWRSRWNLFIIFKWFAVTWLKDFFMILLKSKDWSKIAIMEFHMKTENFQPCSEFNELNLQLLGPTHLPLWFRHDIPLFLFILFQKSCGKLISFLQIPKSIIFNLVIVIRIRVIFVMAAFRSRIPERRITQGWYLRPYFFYHLMWLNDAIWHHHRFWSTLVQVKVCHLLALSD